MNRAMIGAAAAALALACALPTLAAAPAPAPAAVDLGPNVTVGHILGDTGTTIVGHFEGAPVAAVELWYRAPSSGFGAKPQLSLARLAAQTAASSKPLVGDPLGVVVSDAGGKMQITSYGDSLSISALVPVTAARAVVHAMSVAFFAPVLTEDGFQAAQRDLAAAAIIAGFDPDAAIRNALFGALFASGPQRDPPLGTAKDVAGISFDDVKSFATRAFRAQNAILVVNGAVDGTVLADLAKARPATGDEVLAENPASSALAASPAPVHATFEEPAAGFAWRGPPISDERAATAMDFVADYLFRPDSGVVATELSRTTPAANANGQFITLRDPGIFFVSLSGADVARQQDDTLAALRALKTPLAADAFGRARAAFEYHLLSDVQTAGAIADNYGWYAVEGNLPYAPGANGVGGAYFKAAESLTPEFVAQMVQHYLAPEAAVTATLATPPKKPATTGSSS